MELRTYAEVVAALAEPALVPVPPAESPQAAPDAVGTAAWLRAQVARFAHGSEHARRRAVIEAELARIDPGALRKAAAADGLGDLDPRARSAFVLAGALGLADPGSAAADVGLVSAVYFGRDSVEADAAVARLVAAFAEVPGPSSPEEIANRVSILIQAHEATGSLVERAAKHMTDGADAADVDAVIRETLRHDPPLLTMRRTALRATCVAGVDIAEGDLVTLDIAAANRDGDTSAPVLTFGSEPRRCPGEAHALALAAGILASTTANEKDGRP